MKYDVDLSDGDASNAEDEDDDKDDDSGGRFRKLKRQAPKPAAARKLTLQSSQDDTAPQQDAEPGSSAENLGESCLIFESCELPRFCDNWPCLLSGHGSTQRSMRQEGGRLVRLVSACLEGLCLSRSHIGGHLPYLPGVERALI